MKNEIFEIKLLFSKLKLEFLCLNYQKKINTIAIYKIIQKRGYFIMKIITNCKDVKKLAEINKAYDMIKNNNEGNSTYNSSANQPYSLKSPSV